METLLGDSKKVPPILKFFQRTGININKTGEDSDFTFFNKIKYRLL